MERHRDRHQHHSKQISASSVSRFSSSIPDYTSSSSSISSSAPTLSPVFQSTPLSAPSLPNPYLSTTPPQSSSPTLPLDLSPLDPHFHKYFSKKLGIFYSELRVLLILDSALESSQFTALLKHSGYPLVDCCKTLSEAFHLLRTNHSPSICSTYSFILCDCTLVQETLKLIQTLPSLLHVPFIAIANPNQLDLAGTSLLLGADDCLFRPLTTEMMKGLWKHIWRKKMAKNLHDSLMEEQNKTKQLEERYTATLSYMSMHIKPFLDNVRQSLLHLLSSCTLSTYAESIQTALQRLLQQLQNLPSLTLPSLIAPSHSSSLPTSSSSTHHLTYFLELPSSLPNPSHLNELQNWNFDVFKRSHAELVLFLLELFVDLDLLSPFNISNRDFYEFLISVEKGYSIHLNPYHHFRHAFDVTQAVYFFLKAFKAASLSPGTPNTSVSSSKSPSKFSEGPSSPSTSASPASSHQPSPFFTKEEQFALMVACVCHDLEHDGKTNQFHIKTASELAYLFNDQSPLENHHTRACFKLLHHHRLLDAFTQTTRSQLRGLIIQCILATDMSKHSDILHRFQAFQFDWQDTHHRTKLLEMLIKCADVSNVLRPLPLAKQWAEAIQEEMFRMGDVEKLLNITLSVFCDRTKPQAALLGKSFCENLCLPMFQSVAHVVPLLQPCFTGIKKTQAYWSSVLQEKKIE